MTSMGQGYYQGKEKGKRCHLVGDGSFAGSYLDSDDKDDGVSALQLPYNRALCEYFCNFLAEKFYLVFTTVR